MKKKMMYLITNCFIILTLLLISCGGAQPEEKKETISSEEESFSKEVAITENEVYDQLDPQGMLILADKLEKGEPYVQKFKHVMTGDILEKRIVGIEDGKILYIEEMPGGFELECRFSLESAKAIAQYYRDYAAAGDEPVGKIYVINGKEVGNPLQECTDIGECVLINPYITSEEQQPAENAHSEETTPTGTEYHIELFKQVTAYRDQHAITSFEINPGTKIISGELNITAYNADPNYLRSISFSLGSDGGYIGTSYVGPGQTRGEGTIRALETKSWVYDLSQMMVADLNAPEGYRIVDYVSIINNLIQTSTPIEVQAWVSTFTPTAWISASLELTSGEQQTTKNTQVEETTQAGTKTVTFPDEKLAAAIRAALGKGADDEITVAELSELTYLSAVSEVTVLPVTEGITNITGIEYCVNLTGLDLSYNQIRDISPLVNLINLTNLDLKENQISDISPLANLTRLTFLQLSWNQIRDISPLTNLTDLTDIDLQYNLISDISPLANLTSLTLLLLWENPLSDESINIIIPQLTERGVEVWCCDLY